MNDKLKKILFAYISLGVVYIIAVFIQMYIQLRGTGIPINIPASSIVAYFFAYPFMWMFAGGMLSAIVFLILIIYIAWIIWGNKK